MDTSTTVRSRIDGRQHCFRAGARDIAPFVVGYAPMAVGIGVAIGDSGVDRLAGWAGGPLISAGTAQLTLLELVAAGASVLVAIGAALVVNARLVAYSAGMAQWFGAAPLRVRPPPPPPLAWRPRPASRAVDWRASSTAPSS